MDSPRSPAEYAAFRQEVLRRVLSGAKPGDVADLLEVELERFPQIDPEEIARYRRMEASR